MMTAMSHVALLVNPRAGGGRAAEIGDAIVDRLADHDVTAEVLTADSPTAVTAAVAASSADRVLVAGGDGAVHHAVAALAGSGRVLGLVAAGTGNDAARALGLDHGELADRVDRALADPVPVDVITGGPRPALTSVAAGFPATVNERADAMAFPKGPARYTLATLAEIPAMRTARYTLALDGKTVELTAAVVVVANTAFFGAGMMICPDADPADGLLDVCIVGDVSRLELLRSFRMVGTGAHVDHPKVSMFRAAEVAVSGVGRYRADGEAMADLPATLRADPGALLMAGASTRPPDRG